MKAVMLLLVGLALFGGDYEAMRASFDKGDINRAIAITRTNAMNGNVNAMYDLGLLYYAKGSVGEAKSWLERSVKNGGKGELGVSLILFTYSSDRRGYRNVVESLIDVPKGRIRDALMAVSKDLAENRNDASAESYLVLAELFSTDLIIRPDMRIALYLTNQAAKKGNPKALEMMGDAYWRSNETQDSLIVAPQTGNALNVALEYYSEASRLGNLDAMAKMGRLFIIGPRNIRRIQYGIDLILNAAEQGSALGAKMAADLYINGQGVPANAAVALQWYLKATSICEVNGILAQMYGSGEEAQKFASAYNQCSKERSSRQRYHLLFEPF